jgi:ABC-2 type transport system permease protein
MSAPMPTRPGAVRGIAVIVRRELAQYLGTWSGYVIAAAMLLASGLFHNVFALGSTPRYSQDVLSDYFFFQSGTTIVAGILFAMRLIAEERQAGTLPLLATSPLTDGQVVLAKFLSALLALAIFLALTVHMPALVFLNGKVSVGHIFAGYLGLLLLGSASVAIGLFGSAIAATQVVAAVVAGVITVVMLLFWLTARLVDGPLGEVIAYLSLHDKHYRPFMDGTVSLANVIFYLSVTAFFLMLARNVLEARRWRP